MIGLEDAGKTTILYQLKLGFIVTSVTTFVYNCETITHNDHTLTVWDIAGQSSLRPTWRGYFENAVEVIYVVDLNDREKIQLAKGELWRMLDELDDMGLAQIPLLVYANKQDIRFAMTVSEVRDALDLEAVQGREWHILGTSIMHAVGYREGLDWHLAQLHGRT